MDARLQIYVNRLNEAVGHFKAFERVFLDLKADKTVKENDMNLIANTFIGGRPTSKTRAKALDSVLDAFEVKTLQEVIKTGRVPSYHSETRKPQR